LRIVAAFVAGLVFGLGLLLSGMADPAKVLGFLDLAGAWDPSLVMVMVGAIALAALAFAGVRGRATSLLGDPIQLPTKRTIDRRLIVGALLFGAGWGLAGFCPGPALVALGMGVPQAIVFVVAMLAGMGLFEWLEARGKSGM
jgi:uncharacterized membrane protein YedE/YeeE